jgi:signal transduction histidine kinase
VDRLLVAEAGPADRPDHPLAKPTAEASATAWSKGMTANALGNLAHELRTPIQVMLGLLDILQDEYADQIGEKPRALLERMNVNAFDLGQTLDNLMTFVLAKEGKPSTVDEDLSLESLLADIGPTLDAANRAKGLKLCFDFKQAPAVIRAPPHHVNGRQSRAQRRQIYGRGDRYDQNPAGPTERRRLGNRNSGERHRPGTQSRAA